MFLRVYGYVGVRLCSSVCSVSMCVYGICLWCACVCVCLCVCVCVWYVRVCVCVYPRIHKYIYTYM